MSESNEVAANPSFARTFLLPALWVLVLPLFSYWFANQQLNKWSTNTQNSIVKNARVKGRTITAAQMRKLQTFDVGKMSFKVCGSFGFFKNPGRGSKLCSTVLQFAWAKWLGLMLLFLALGAALLVGLGLLWTKFDANNQHRGFQLGWVTLRLFGVVHILTQGLLAVFLSFWITAIWMSVYVPKLILIVAVLAAFAVFVSLKALFATSPAMLRVHGAKLAPEDAPEFVAHIDALATEMGTAAPANIVVGIDDNFFVTESPFLIYQDYPSDEQPYTREQELEGRSLFVSLPLMRVLEKKELDGVLAHELAHFLAGDTAQMRKLNMQYRKFDSYAGQLTENFTWGVASCMVAFRAVFELITQSHSRTAEFRADANAAAATSSESIIKSLMKIAAYSTYRQHTEVELLNEMSQQDDLRIADRVSRGFATFLDGKELNEKILQEETPHPFDSHPPLRERIANLDAALDPVRLAGELEDVPKSSWCEAIVPVDALETKLWDAYERQFQSQHEFLIALRLRPTNAEEVAHVERFFPSFEHYSKKSELLLTVTWEGLTLQDGETIEFDDVASLEKQDGTFYGESLVIQCHSSRGKVKAPLGPGSDVLLAALNERWQRHQIAAAEADESAPRMVVGEGEG